MYALRKSVGAKEHRGIWRWAVPYEYLFLKILLPRQTGLLPRRKVLVLRLTVTLTITVTRIKR